MYFLAIVYTMIRKLVLTTVLMLSVFTLVSCGTKNPDLNSNSSSSSSADNSSSVDDESKDKIENESENKNNNSETQTETEDKNNTQSNSKNDENSVKFSLYSIDENSLEPNEVGSVSIDASKNLKDKLTELSNSISKTNFDGLKLTVKSIDTVDGKKVATINLTDSGNKSWVQKFQGSTGGQVTANTLIENYLQTNNKSNSEWIDGVKFLYNDEAIEYDHVSDLSEIHYR